MNLGNITIMFTCFRRRLAAFCLQKLWSAYFYASDGKFPGIIDFNNWDRRDAESVPRLEKTAALAAARRRKNAPTACKIGLPC